MSSRAPKTSHLLGVRPTVVDCCLTADGHLVVRAWRHTAHNAARGEEIRIPLIPSQLVDIHQHITPIEEANRVAVFDRRAEVEASLDDLDAEIREELRSKT